MWLRRTFSISYLSIFDYFHGNVYPRTCLFCLDCCQLLLYRFFFSFFFFYTFCISHKARLIFITKNQLCLFNVPNFYPFYVYHQFYLSYFHVHNFFFSTKFFFFFFFQNVADENQARRILFLCRHFFFFLFYLFTANGVFLYTHRDKYTFICYYNFLSFVIIFCMSLIGSLLFS